MNNAVKREVDEVGGLAQADGEEHEGDEPSLRLGLAGDTLDGRATGEPVTDGCADRATAEGQPSADHGAGELNRLRGNC